MSIHLIVPNYWFVYIVAKEKEVFQYSLSQLIHLNSTFIILQMLIIYGDAMKFHVVRLSFASLKQKKLNKAKFEGSRMDLVEKLLIENFEYLPVKKRGFVGFHLGDFITDNNRLYFATLGTNRNVKIQKFDQDKKRHYQKSDLASPWVYFLVDNKEQTFIIGKNANVFYNYETLFHSLQTHLNNLLGKYDLFVTIIPITEDIDFWNLVQKNQYIYEVGLKLTVPNLFGHTNEALKESLQEDKDEYNATEVMTQISNPDGQLKISDADPKINRFLDWIIKGGGIWTIKAKKNKKGKKTKYSSSKQAKTITTAIETEISDEKPMDLERTKSIISSMKSFYAVMDNGTENDDDK